MFYFPDVEMVCTDVIVLFYTGALPCENFDVGIGDRARVKDSQMTASSSLGRNFRPFHARLASARDRGWCASTETLNTYLEIDLERDYVFCGIRVQGGTHGHVNTFQLRFARGKEGSFIPYDKVRDGVTTEHT